jgi:hypothetical protein
MFFPAFVFLAIRQAARLQALPYLLHDFTGAFLAAATSFDRDVPIAGPLTTSKLKKPTDCACGIGSSVRALGQFIER